MTTSNPLASCSPSSWSSCESLPPPSPSLPSLSPSLRLLSYAQWVVLKARKHRFILLKKQLLLVGLGFIVTSLVLIIVTLQEAADSTFYGHELQKKAKEEEGVVREEGGVAPLQQRLSALQDMTEEERDKVLQEKRLSVQVSFLPHDLSHMTSS